MRKKRIVTITASVAVLLILAIASFLIGTGFHKREDVILDNYSVSEDGAKLNFTVAVPASMGYVRRFSDKGGGVKPHYLTFYSAFGGLNGSLGAKCEFELELDKNDEEIYFNRPNGGNELVLQKNTLTGKWERP